MAEATFVALVQNAAFLLAMALLYDLALGRQRIRSARVRQVVVGFMIGVVGLVVMLTPFEYATGIIFDTRSVLLGVAGLFFGAVPTAVAMAMTAALRLAIGGTATVMGVSVILASGCIGIAWRRRRGRELHDLSLREAYLFGLVIHAVMVALIFTLPWPVALNVLAAIGPPVIVVYPVATALLAALLVDRLRRERERDALRLSEERLRLAADAAAMGLYDVNVQTGEATVNEHYALMLGFDPASFHETNAAWIERLHPDDREPVAAMYRDYVAGKVAEYRAEFRQRTVSGDWKWILSMGRLVERDAQGAPLRMLGTHLDISAPKQVEEQLRAAAAEAARLLEQEVRSRRALLSIIEDERAIEAALRESEARFRAVAESANDGIITVDDTGTIESWNRGAERIFGYTAVEILGQPIAVLIPERHRAVHHPETGPVFAGQTSNPDGRPAESDGLRKDSSKTPVEISVATWELGGRRFYTAIVRDITERKAAETEILRLNETLEERVRERTAELEAANKELESFSYSVSHDLRAPLRAITGFAEILGRRYRDRLDPKGRHYVDTIVESGMQMGVLIEELLDLSRLGRGTVRTEPVPLAPLLTSLRSTYGAQIKAAGATLAAREPLAVPVGDPVLIERILANLLENALTYRRPDVAPAVIVSATRHGGSVILAVADNGIGIPAEYHERIFEVFARLHAGEAYPGGTGIGLSIVRKAARLMGSDMTVESIEGEGSTFSLVLPVAPEGSAKP